MNNKNVVSEQIKVTEEELELLNRISDEFNAIVFRFGNLDIEQKFIDERQEELLTERAKLDSEFENLRKKENEAAQKLNEKYGIGAIDQKTGIFQPSMK